MTTHVAALSGGADSTAMAIAMSEAGMHVDHYLCTPTGNETPDMLLHWARLEALLGKKLTMLSNKAGGLVQLSIAQTTLPSVRMRWCTRMLKIEPCLAFLARETARTGDKPILYVGLRADEETRDGLYSDMVETRCPLREWGWTRADVVKFLSDRSIRVPPRTDCAICPEQRLVEWWWLWKFHPDLYDEGVRLEALVSSERGEQYTIRNPGRDSWPAGLAELRERFEAGQIPTPRKLQMTMFDGETTGKCRVCTL